MMIEVVDRSFRVKKQDMKRFMETPVSGDRPCDRR